MTVQNQDLGQVRQFNHTLHEYNNQMPQIHN